MRLIVENNIATLVEGDITVASNDLKEIIDHIKKDKSNYIWHILVRKFRFLFEVGVFNIYCIN